MKVIKGCCCHCGITTSSVWMKTASPDDAIVHICSDCLSKAMVGYYVTPAYERVGQATYYGLLKPKPKFDN